MIARRRALASRMLHWHRQARLYATLAQTLESGLPPDRALELAAAAAGGTPGARARQAALRIAAGTPLCRALGGAGEDAMACAVLAAGDAAGRTPALCRQLGEAFALRARLRDDAVSRLAYPALLAHLALLLLPLPWVVREDGLPVWCMLLGPLLLWGLLAAAALAAWWSGRAGVLARLALRAPLAALCRPALAADAAAVLGAALAAGMLVPDALELAAGACANRELARRLAAAGIGVRQGRVPDLSAALADCGFAGDLLELVRAGERAGRLEQGLAQMRTVAAERFAWRLQWTARLATGAAYAGAMLIAAATVFAMYGQVYGGLMREAGALE